METFSSSPNDKCLEDLLSKHAATSKAHEGLRILEVCHGPFKHHDFLVDRFPGAVHLHCHQCASGKLKPCDKNGPSAFRSAVTYSSGTARSIAASNQSQDLVILAYAGYETMEDSQRLDVLKEALRVLRSGGYLVLEIPCLNKTDEDLQNTHSNLNFHITNELERTLQLCGFSICPHTIKRDNEHFLLVQKPDFALEQTIAYIDQPFYAHQHLSADEDPKGRATRATNHIPAGSLLMVDSPFASVPYRGREVGEHLFCSSEACSVRLPRGLDRLRCDCDEDVVWCSDSCWEQDAPRHNVECTWLRLETTNSLRHSNQEEFYLIWLTIRLLIKSSRRATASEEADTGVFGGITYSFDTVLGLSANRANYTDEKIESWTQLACTHIKEQLSCAAALSIQEIVRILGMVDTNFYYIHPGAVGDTWITEHFPQGIAYAMSLYTRATLVNHSCLPNVSRLYSTCRYQVC